MIRQQDIIVEVSDSQRARRDEFKFAIESGENALKAFADRHGLANYMQQSLIKRAIFVDCKQDFDDLVRRSYDLPLNAQIPGSYVAATKADVLWILLPEEVARSNPSDAQDPEFYSKLIAHELGHLLHIRALAGQEDAMGPVWFYEGFAVAAANQYEDFSWTNYKNELEQIVRDPTRGSYKKYGTILRSLLKRHPMCDLISRAKEQDFNDWALTSLRVD